jgi:hypothetical protein
VLRVGAQLVVHTFDEEENLVLLDSEFFICVWLGFVVVGGLEDGEVGFWIVGHVEEGVRFEVTVVIRSFPSIPHPQAFSFLTSIAENSSRDIRKRYEHMHIFIFRISYALGIVIGSESVFR